MTNFPLTTINDRPTLTSIAEALLPLAKPFGVQIKVEEVQVKSSRDASTIAFLKLGKPQPPEETINTQRLWINCHCDYPLASERIVPLLIQKLRQLNLQNYQDVLLSGYLEERNKPLWVVKSFLTSTQELLRAWAKWGDGAALVELLNLTLEREGISFRSITKEATLHLFASTLGSILPEKSLIMEAIAPLLRELVSPGVQAVVLYGITSQGQIDPITETPTWVEWLNLTPHAPPLEVTNPNLNLELNPELNAKKLARKGDEAAIKFLLHKVINPDLKIYLATGGIDVLIKQQGDLLHVVAEAPLCPSQAEVVKPIVRYLLSLKIPTIAGVRIYGRPTGKSHPDWQFGKDFHPRSTPRSSTVKQSQFQKSQFQKSAVVTVAPPQKSSPLLQPLRSSLVRSGLFCDQVNPESGQLDPKVALVWGALGLLLLFQTDWLLGVLNKRQLAQSASKAIPVQTIQLPTSPETSGNTSETQGFNNSGFTSNGNNVVIVDQQNQQVKSVRIAQATSALLAAGEQGNPSFNSSLLNEKLLLYQQRVNQSGRPADVLIIGSSRALRGIDPLVLKEALTKEGYKQVDIFNFGINGATVKFVDFLVRRMLTPEQLPKLIIWADGVRAFNSGREDLTYNALLNTEGYRQTVAGTFPVQSESTNPTPNQFFNHRSLARLSFSSGNDRLLQVLGNFSQSYNHRQQMILTVQKSMRQLLPGASRSLQPQSLEPLVNESAIDIDGFLPLGDRFIPQTYYQKYAKVPGSYDKDYEAFHLDGRQDAALGELTQYLQRQGVTTVFVNLPLTDHYLDEVRTKYEQQFEQYLQERSQKYKFIVRNLNTSRLRQYDYFSDPSHLNRYGAESLSRQLAQDPVIPWPSR